VLMSGTPVPSSYLCHLYPRPVPLADVTPYMPQVILFGGAVLAALLAGIFTMVNMWRTISWQRKESLDRSRAENERLQQTFHEERRRKLWDEQRSL
jgi:hypothetical protein